MNAAPFSRRVVRVSIRSGPSFTSVGGFLDNNPLVISQPETKKGLVTTEGVIGRPTGEPHINGGGRGERDNTSRLESIKLNRIFTKPGEILKHEFHTPPNE